MSDQPASMTTTEQVPSAIVGERLDRAVAVLLAVTRTEAGELVDGGAVRVNGAVVVKRSYRVRESDRIDPGRGPEPVDHSLTGDPEIGFAVVYVDDDVIVVDKPAGLVVHPGAGSEQATLVHGLLGRFPDLADLIDAQPDRPGIVHRLDKGTSGLLVVARNGAAVTSLIDQLQQRSVSRVYTALVRGELASSAGRVEAPIGRHPGDPLRMAVAATGRPAITHYVVQRRFEHPEALTLLECRLETGRTHQIRVHLAALGHTVVGDSRYGDSSRAPRCDRPWLHAARLAFDHPRTGERLQFDSPLPDDLAQVLAMLG